MSEPNNTCKTKGCDNGWLYDPEWREHRQCPNPIHDQQPKLDMDDMTHEERIEYLKANDLPKAAELYQKALDMSDPKSNKSDTNHEPSAEYEEGWAAGYNARIADESDPKSNNNYDLQFCPTCYQMTNHLEGICMKHKSNKSELTPRICSCPIGKGRSALTDKSKCLIHKQPNPAKSNNKITKENDMPTPSESNKAETPEVCECGHGWGLHSLNREADYYCSVESCPCPAYTPDQPSNQAEDETKQVYRWLDGTTLTIEGKKSQVDQLIEQLRELTDGASL